MAEDEDQIAKLQKQLDDLLKRRPEHCSGRDEYVGVHKASPELMEKIEELEEKIRALKEKAGKPSGRRPTRSI